MILAALLLAFVPPEKLPDPDASAYSALLGKHVRAGLVDYTALRQERGALDAYLKAAGAARGEHGLAFWINVYDASVIRDLLDSGKELPAKVSDLKGFFDGTKHAINGESWTLNELEGFIRKQWKDPRVHFALVCGAKSCPPLPARAFTDEKLGATLDELTRAFLDGPGIVLDAQKKELRVTKVCEWYRDDFVQKDGSLESFLRKHVRDGNKLDALDPGRGWKLAFQEYDWTPNARK